MPQEAVERKKEEEEEAAEKAAEGEGVLGKLGDTISNFFGGGMCLMSMSSPRNSERWMLFLFGSSKIY